MNPPFKGIYRWVRKAYASGRDEATFVVCLLPSRTGTIWFHRFVVESTLWFIKGRLYFEDYDKEKKTPAPFDSIIVIFPKIETIEARGLI